eukprot:TRINITY_DN4005_c1_g1_i2.p1 TRINITY_DN4005_c1_g1~~TRINITY_DN4005_c1_g1_i2.p1  ORF type:complete len:2826 (+),score=696.32 TRINITY_DN4005_c1_g1_i2:356-8479(+)
MAGGTNVTVVGNNFVGTQPFCMFGALSSVPATKASTSLLYCETPASASGSVSVEVSNNNLDYTANAVQFTFLQNIAVSSLVPNVGPLTGGTVVVVGGISFVSSSTLVCRFGSFPASAASWLSATRVQCASPPASVTSVTVEVSNNNQDFTTNGQLFEYIIASNVSSLFPTAGATAGGVVVTVYGASFTPSMYCRFDTTVVFAQFNSTTSVTCVTPSHAFGSVAVEVSTNNQDFTANNVQYAYLPAAAVSAVVPTSGSVVGGTNVTVTGINFVGSQITCRFELSPPVAARQITSTQIECTTPALAAGSVSVEVSTNNADYTANRIQFTYLLAASVTGVLPVSGPVTGATLTTVRGTNFANIFSLRCKFGTNAPVLATWFTATRLQCYSPLAVAGAVAVEVSNNNQDYTTDNVQYAFQPTVTITQVLPTSGPISGNTRVQVRGTEFVNVTTLYCLFDESRVLATFATTTSVFCVAPTHIAGPYAVQVSNNNQDFSASAVTYRYMPASVITSVVPTTGAVSGGTNVTVTGVNFLGPTTYCAFGSSAPVLAAVVSDTQIACLTPSMAAGSYSVEVTNNNQDYTSSGVQFVFQLSETVSAVAPLSGPVSGGTALTVIGTNFVNSAQVVCRVGTVSALPATWNSVSRIRCTSPAMTAGVVNVDVSNNNQDYTSGSISYIYRPLATVISVNPANAPAIGTTVVNVTGTNFPDTTLYCKFAALVVPATWLSVSQISCVAPSNAVGTVTVEMSYNNQDFTGSGVTFVYDPVAAVASVIPLTGPISGGSTVSVYGVNFVGATVMCRFGSTTTFAAVTISSTLVTCLSPPMAAGSYSVELSNNNVTFTQNSVQFLYLAAANVSHVIPPSGPRQGGTLISVFGSSFVNSAQLMCRFGSSAPVVATWLTFSKVQCYSSAFTQPSVPVEVSNNNADFTANGQLYSYFGLPNVTSITPVTGRSLGGTPVTVSGINFLTDALWCKFGSADPVQGVVLTVTLANCTAPAQAAASVAVEVSTNNVDYSADGVQYLYRAPSTVSSTFPASGPVTGGSSVIVIGDVFYTGSTWCLFGTSASIVASVSSSSTATCTSPPAIAAGSVAFATSNNNADFSYSGLAYTYTPVENVTLLKPATGPVTGDIVVTVFGGNFVNLNSLVCRFGSAGVVAATWQSVSKLLCVSPTGTGTVAVEVSNNNQDFSTSGVIYTFQPVVTIAALSPSFGIASGGTSVTVTGSNFLASPVYCRFGSVVVVVSAVPTTATSAVCTAPSSTVGPVAVEVSNNNQDYSTSGVLFNVIADPRPTVLAPMAGPTTGGTLVNVTGTFLYNSSLLVCRFGTQVVAATGISSTSLLCRSPVAPNSAAGLVSLEVSPNGQDYSSTGVQFMYYTPTVVSSLLPVRGSLLGGSIVTVTGANFINFNTLACRFNGTAAQATWLTASTVACLSPAALGIAPVVLGRRLLSDGVQIPVEISNNGAQYSASNVPYLYTNPVAVRSISPVNGPTNGIAVLTIAGENFTTDFPMQCRFNLTVVAATVLSSSQLTCSSPPSVPGVVSVELSGNNQDYSSNGISFMFYTPEVLLSMVPLSASTAGETTITINGANFVAGAACSFGGIRAAAPAVFISSTQMTCVTPSLSPAGIYAVAVANNNVTFSSSTLQLSVYTPPVVTMLSPTNGPISGGTLVAVNGSNFINSVALACKFGVALPTAATWLSATLVRCASPASFAGFEAVEVSNNFQDFTSNNINFNFVPVATVSTLNPANGPTIGGTRVSVSGTNFLNSGVWCKVDANIVVGTYVSASSAVCITPPHSNASVPLEMSNNNADFTSSGVLFAYQPQLVITALAPQYGPVSGGTLVNVTGTSFVAPLFCKFGTHTASSAVSATSTFAVCRSPASTVSTVSLELSSNQQVDFTNQQVGFTYYANVSLDQVTPISGTVLGNTRVIVTGTNFLAVATIVCAFDRAVTQATWITVSTLSCMSPPHIAGPALLEISMNGHDFAPSSKGYIYLADIVLTKLEPASTLSNAPTVIAIHGRNFDNTTTLNCLFGTYQVPAQWFNSTLIYCTTPRHPEAVTTFNVTNNGQDYTQQDVSFTFVALCPTGYYCVGSTAIACRNGTFCAGEGNFNETFCPPGTYQPDAGQTSCLPCVAGTHCPGFGTITPSRCPAGKVCESDTDFVSPRSCPAGYFCTVGTDVYNASIGSGSQPPRSCPAGYYCGGGVATNESVVGDFTTPQPCLAGYYCPGGAARPQGIGLCPAGYYCPTGTATPILVPAGYFAAQIGNDAPRACFPGTYQNSTTSLSCDPCPAGYQCLGFATVTPSMCAAGTYRSANMTVECQACPYQHASNFAGATSVDDCYVLDIVTPSVIFPWWLILLCVLLGAGVALVIIFIWRRYRAQDLKQPEKPRPLASGLLSRARGSKAFAEPVLPPVDTLSPPKDPLEGVLPGDSATGPPRRLRLKSHLPGARPAKLRTDQAFGSPMDMSERPTIRKLKELSQFLKDSDDRMEATAAEMAKEQLAAESSLAPNKLGWLKQLREKIESESATSASEGANEASSAAPPQKPRRGLKQLRELALPPLDNLDMTMKAPGLVDDPPQQPSVPGPRKLKGLKDLRSLALPKPAGFPDMSMMEPEHEQPTVHIAATGRRKLRGIGNVLSAQEGDHDPYIDLNISTPGRADPSAADLEVEGAPGTQKAAETGKQRVRRATRIREVPELHKVLKDGDGPQMSSPFKSTQ